MQERYKQRREDEYSAMQYEYEKSGGRGNVRQQPTCCPLVLNKYDPWCVVAPYILNRGGVHAICIELDGSQKSILSQVMKYAKSSARRQVICLAA